MKTAAGAIGIIMDGDLQHPELIPKLLAEIEASTAEIVVASSYVDTARNAGPDSWYRVASSKGVAGFARLLFPVMLHPITDPMGGLHNPPSVTRRLGRIGIRDRPTTRKMDPTYHWRPT